MNLTRRGFFGAALAAAFGCFGRKTSDTGASQIVATPMVEWRNGKSRTVQLGQTGVWVRRRNAPRAKPLSATQTGIKWFAVQEAWPNHYLGDGVHIHSVPLIRIRADFR